MIQIAQVLAIPAAGAYYIEDLTALQERPTPLPDRYTADPVTPGFRTVRQVAEGVSVGLVLEDSSGRRQVAWGDCVAVAYSGKAGREPVFSSQRGISTIREVVEPFLVGRPVTSFRELASAVDALIESVTVVRPVPQLEPVPRQGSDSLSRRDFLAAPVRFFRSVRDEIESEDAPETAPRTVQVIEERPIHTAVRYGVSQALLGAAALARETTLCEVIAEEWGLPTPDCPIPIHAQSGGERYHGADKMIARRVASLPHALVDDIPEQLGKDGSVLVGYTRWLSGRIQQLAGEDYRPTIHLDVHGALGQIFDNQAGKILGHLYALEQAARPFPLRVECPVDMGSRAEQIEMMAKLRDYVRFRKMTVQLVADEWANTLDDIRAFVDAGAADMIQIKMPDLGSIHNSVDAVLLCRDAEVGAFLGGSCAETDLSARISVHVGLAARPDILMAKPGMGVDEAVSLVQNEMARTLAQIDVSQPRRSEGQD